MGEAGTRRVPTLPRSVPANNQLAGLRLLGVHDPAILPAFSSDVVITGAFRQGGLNRPNTHLATPERRRATGLINKDAL
jgi:hypothetical protein